MRSAAQAHAAAYLDEGRFAAELAELVAHRSESQRIGSLADCRAYLTKAMGPRLEALGFACRLIDNPVSGAGPVLLAERIEGAELPTVLGYGHGDVVLGQAGHWAEGRDPWDVTRVGERLYGRGTADNKSQHLINLRAMEAVIATRGALGFNAKMLIETGEEIGSPGLGTIIEAHRAELAADVFIASDGPRVQPGRPTAALGCRGAVNFDLVCDLRRGAHHSGNWGGALADPAMILAQALATIVTPEGAIAVPEWRPEPPRPLIRDLLGTIALAAGPDGPQVEPDWGEPGLTPAERVYAWNSFAVLALHAGHPEAPLNAIAPAARAHCQLRFIAGTDMAGILPALRRHLDRHGYADRVRIDTGTGRDLAFPASRTEPDAPWAAWVRAAVERATGAPPAVLPQLGGSICNALFTDVLGLPAIWLPHSYAGCCQHAPDEHVLLPTCRSALEMMAGIYWDLGDPALAKPTPAG